MGCCLKCILAGSGFILVRDSWQINEHMHKKVETDQNPLKNPAAHRTVPLLRTPVDPLNLQPNLGQQASEISPDSALAGSKVRKSAKNSNSKVPLGQRRPTWPSATASRSARSPKVRFWTFLVLPERSEAPPESPCRKFAIFPKTPGGVIPRLLQGIREGNHSNWCDQRVVLETSRMGIIVCQSWAPTVGS